MQLPREAAGPASCKLPAWILITTLCVSACATKSYVVLLPSPDGTVGKVSIRGSTGEQVLDTAGQAGATDGTALYQRIYRDQIVRDFADTIAARPEIPGHPLSFEEGQTLPLEYQALFPTQASTEGISVRRSFTTPSAPATSAPATSAPATSAPATSAPATSAPATSAPATSAPATSAPATSAPATSAPATSAPATSAPATSAPASSPPASSPPPTSPPSKPSSPPSSTFPSNGQGSNPYRS